MNDYGDTSEGPSGQVPSLWGSAHCDCVAPRAAGAQLPNPVPNAVRVNGRRVTPRNTETQVGLQERVWAEVLRQEAVARGVLADVAGEEAPVLDERDQAVISAMLDEVVEVPTPDINACRRYHEAHLSKYVHGQAAHVRHILFAVTSGVRVQALARRAESLLLDLVQRRTTVDFATAAREFSNCPSGIHGGNIGWIGPRDCAPELAKILFLQPSGIPVGLQPRLVHSRFGFHIIDVLEARLGVVASFEEVEQRIAAEMETESRATALRHFMQVLIGQSTIEGLELPGSASPLLQ